MAFKYHKSLRGVGAPTLIRVIIDNSEVITLGDLVKTYNAGNAEVATAGNSLAGFVRDVQTKDGRKPTTDSGTDDTWTAAADNETVDQIAAFIDMDTMSIYSGAQDGTVGATNSSDKQGALMDIADEATIDESTAIRTGTAQLYGYGTDPNDSTRILVAIAETERLGLGTF